MKLIYKSIFLTAITCFMGCSEDFENDVDDIVVTSGDADFTTYVALGNSLTSGFSDGALYKSAQDNSYPAIVAAQMQKAGGGEFSQPLMPDDIGGFANFGINGKLTLQIVNGSPAPVATPAASNYEPVAGPFNNMGVPGAKSFHLLAPGYGNAAGIATGMANPYFARFASSSNTTVFEDAMAQSPTFFSLWIGNNDILGYAMNGGAGTNQAGNFNPSTYGGTDMSAPEVVANVIQNITTTMTSAGAKGILANIPDVTSIPFFTTIPAKPLSPSNSAYAAQIGTLNGFYASLNQVFAAIGASDRQIVFNDNAASGIVFVDDSLDNLAPQIAGVLIQTGMPAAKANLIASIYGQARQSREGDLIPLTMSSKIATLDEDRMAFLMANGVSQQEAGQLSIVGLTYPADEFVLSSDEVDQVASTTYAINSAISQIASANNIAVVDTNKMMKQLQSGMMFDAVNYNANFITGGAFSLDGIHLNGRGYAILANAFINAINNKYNANLPRVVPNNYPGTDLP